SSGFTIDTTPPVVVIQAPPEGSYQRATPVAVSGTAVDADPNLVVECRRGDVIVPATAGQGAFACETPLVEGENTITVVAHDRLAREGSASRMVRLDTRPPVVTIVMPTAGEFTNASTVTVKGGVQDASPIASVDVNGVAAQVEGSSF